MTRINREIDIITDDFELEEETQKLQLTGVLKFHYYIDDDKIVNLMIGTKNLGYITVDNLKEFLKDTLAELDASFGNNNIEAKSNGT